MASVMEIYLSGINDDTYIDYVHSDLNSYMNRVDQVVLTSFTAIDTKFREYRQHPFENANDRQKYRTWIKTLRPFKGKNDTSLRQMLEGALKATSWTAHSSSCLPETFIFKTKARLLSLLLSIHFPSLAVFHVGQPHSGIRRDILGCDNVLLQRSPGFRIQICAVIRNKNQPDIYPARIRPAGLRPGTYIEGELHFPDIVTDKLGIFVG